MKLKKKKILTWALKSVCSEFCEEIISQQQYLQILGPSEITGINRVDFIVSQVQVQQSLALWQCIDWHCVQMIGRQWQSLETLGELIETTGWNVAYVVIGQVQIGNLLHSAYSHWNCLQLVVLQV